MHFAQLSTQLIDETAAVLQRVDPAQVDRLVEAIMHSRRLFLDGRGRSGLMMRAFAIRLTHLEIPSHVVGESTTPGLQAGDLLLVGSGSGETLTPLQAARVAKAAGGTVAVFTSRPTSPLAELADLVLLVPAPVRQRSSVELVSTRQPMGSLFEQSLLLLLDAIVLLLKDRLQRDEAMMLARHSNLE